MSIVKLAVPASLPYSATEGFSIRRLLHRPPSASPALHSTLHSTLTGPAVLGRAPVVGRYGPQTTVLGFAGRVLGPEDQPTSISEARTPDALAGDALSARSVICLTPINDVFPMNDFFRTANEALPLGGRVVGCLETIGHRRSAVQGRFPVGLAHLVLFGDFVWNRLFPRLPYVRALVSLLRRGPHRGLSLTECLGRLVYCGFEIVDFEEDGRLAYFVAKVAGPPLTDAQHSHGPLFAMRRIGKDGREIRVYKVRTMHPYSEYLQRLVHERNSLADSGKFQDDFRVTRWGHFFRRTWLDELPMLFNWLKGDLKLVGVRPLSRSYFELYPKSVQAKRLTMKPGLIPPYYADLPGSFEEIVESEERYMDAYRSRPIRTDVAYLFKALRNIVLRGARSS